MDCNAMAHAYMLRIEELSKQWRAQLSKEQRESLAPSDMLVAVVTPVDTDRKKPSVCHIGGKWSHQKFAYWLRRNGSKAMRLGFFMRRIGVIDCDNDESYVRFTTRHPELKAAPMCITNRGKHLYIWVTEAAKKAGVTDGPLVDPVTGVGMKADLKTLTASMVDSNGRPASYENGGVRSTNTQQGLRPRTPGRCRGGLQRYAHTYHV